MKTDNANDAVAKGAAEWQEKLQQDKICKENKERLEKALLSLERTHRTTCTVSDGYNLFLSVDEHFPTEEELVVIMEHGSSENIMKMLKIYATADELVPGTPRYSPQKCAPHPYPLPSIIGAMIAKRNIFAEIDAFTRYQGFDAEGQDILLARGNHTELMWYLERHGFLLTQQRKLIARGNTDEIRQHIRHHGLAPELLDDLLNELENGKTDNFYKFIALRELPVSHQERLLDIVKEPEFLAYINRYGFWEQVLSRLAATRSDTELMAYIKKHRFLGKGIYELVKARRRSVYMFYIQQQECGIGTCIDALSQETPLDYEALSKLYTRIKRPDFLSAQDEKTLAVFANGTHTDVMAFLKQEKPTLSRYVEATLFFRNKPAEYELYLDIRHLHILEDRINSRNS